MTATDLRTFLDETQRDVIMTFKEAQEAYILQFFGSIENLERYGKDYVFEEYPIEMEQSADFNIDLRRDDYKLRFVQNFRIRRKTDEEKAEEEAANAAAGGDDGRTGQPPGFGG